jgi:RimJ/RimL family protein N-acetyltransferase
MPTELRYTLMERRHIEWARKLHNDDSTLFQLTDPEHVSELQQDAWFETISRSRTSKRYVVEAQGSSVFVPIGVFRVDNIDYKNRSVMVGLDLDPEWRGKGLASVIYQHFLDYYFNQCGFNRVCLKVLETNERALHVYRKVGFIEEGRDRAAVFRDGCFRDYISMSILREEYVAATDRRRDVK